MIEVRDLSKWYGKTRAVDGLSFFLGKDQVLGFLGPNGAGKTTVMKILSGFHFPSSGVALVDGIRVEEDPVELKKRIGYLPETAPLYGELTVDEYLSFVVRARLIPPARRREAVNASLEACGLSRYRSRKIETLSKGYRQRTGLAQAIIHDPPILLLDEPTSGLDPNQIIEIRSLIRELGKRKTVILSTHILREVEAVCSQVLIINQGKIAAQGRPEEIAGAMKGGDTWELVLKSRGASPAGAVPGPHSAPGGRLLGEKLGRLGNVVPGPVEELANGTVKLSFFVTRGGEDEGERIFDWAVAEGFKILMMNRKPLSLEDIFVKLTAEDPPRSVPEEGGL
jgi:ABC-2 type transport system ATP-binding protein